MSTITIQLNEQLLRRAQRAAETNGVPIDTVIGEALERHVRIEPAMTQAADISPATGLQALFRMAKENGWQSDGTGYLTDDEMYSR